MALIGNLSQFFRSASSPQELGPSINPSAATVTKGLEQAGFPAATKSVGGTESFGKMVDKFVHEVDGKMNAAQVEQKKVLTGETQNLHQAMISMQEASVSFGLMVEVRNKLVEGYQELMRMQV